MSDNFIKGMLSALAYLLLTFLFAIPTYYLWNWLMPEIFGLKTITFIQAFGINLLTGSLFRANTYGK